MQARESRRARSPAQELAKYAGLYSAVGFGRLELAHADGTLRYRWGVLYGPVEPYDLARNQLRIDFAGSESILEFSVDGRGAVSSVQVEGVTLTRAP